MPSRYLCALSWAVVLAATLHPAPQAGTFCADTKDARPPATLMPIDEAINDLECGAIVGRQVNVRRDPATDAPVVATSSYELLRHLLSGVRNTPEGWTPIETRTGRRGYVRSDYFGAPIGLRALFNRVRGQWRMTALVAGD